LRSACDELDYDAIRNILLNAVVGFKPQHEFVDSLFAQAEKWAENSRNPQKVTKLYPAS